MFIRLDKSQIKVSSLSNKLHKLYDIIVTKLNCYKLSIIMAFIQYSIYKIGFFTYFYRIKKQKKIKNVQKKGFYYSEIMKIIIN